MPRDIEQYVGRCQHVVNQSDNIGGVGDRGLEHQKQANGGKVIQRQHRDILENFVAALHEPVHLKPVYIIITNANLQLHNNAIPQGKACQHYEPEKKCRQMHGRIFGL